MMTQEQKAKAYERALEAARKELGVDRKEWEVVRRVLHNIFPELAESEDERIRKTLIEELKVSNSVGELMFRLPAPTREKCIAWLEKQKEQKPVQDETEREYVRTIKSIIADFIRDKKPEDVGYYQQIYDWLDGRHIEQKPDDDPLDDPKFLKGFDTGREVQRIFDEQKPAEWSEEDEMMVKSIVNVLKRFEHQGATDMKIDWLQNKLKSLRPSWKPSEEQMEALKDAVRLFKDTHFEKYHYKIESLYEQLKSIQ